MDYRIVKMQFSTAVHFGDGGLGTCRNTLYADTIFSALCVEASRLAKELLDELLSAAQNKRILFSDAFPMIGEKLFLPKPMMRIEKNEQAEEDDSVSSSVIKKAAKKLSYIDVDHFGEYVAGKADIVAMVNDFDQSFGSYDLVAKNRKIIDSVDTEPYAIRVFRYKPGSGLYFIIGYDNQGDMDLLSELVHHLSLRGIGGKTSSGYGKFNYEICDLPESLLQKLNKDSEKYMSLTTSIPGDDEIKNIMDDAEYLLVRRGGFVSSETYSDTLRKKQTVFFASSGSVFSKKYDGGLLEVQTSEGNHKVYKYSIPLFVGV